MKYVGFDQLVEEALVQDFSGWDFSWLRGRWYEEDPPWAYEALVAEEKERVASLLDMGTGGGEFLASLSPLPPHTVATESYPPNIPIARSLLKPLGVEVVPFTDDKSLPLKSSQFELIINRHESYDLAELNRLLKPGGRFITQQVGSLDCVEINDFLEAPHDLDTWTLEREVKEFQGAGFRIERTHEAFLDSYFYDIGAVVFFSRLSNGKYQISRQIDTVSVCWPCTNTSRKLEPSAPKPIAFLSRSKCQIKITNEKELRLARKPTRFQGFTPRPLSCPARLFLPHLT
jgi:SAM-dependent methyltransferase